MILCLVYVPSWSILKIPMDYGEGLPRELKFNTPLNIGVCDKIYKRNNKRALSRPRGRLTARLN
jgi:hypothetical protein